MNKVYGYNYLDRLPTSDYTLREQFTFETYINTPEKTPAAELITDIYIPITKKRNMKYLNQEIENELKNHGAGLVRFVGISHLDERQNRQLPNRLYTAFKSRM
nr:GyrI-like domain-containing protein [Bacteroides fragilis]MCY2672435.1 GyrI-like domain-containing protein [Bacteroides fragilis]